MTVEKFLQSRKATEHVYILSIPGGYFGGWTFDHCWKITDIRNAEVFPSMAAAIRAKEDFNVMKEHCTIVPVSSCLKRKTKN